MAWTVYRSTDASAPAVSGTAGALITLLDAILVNGYGSKPAAGWTKAYSGTNKAAYRMDTGTGSNGHYLRVDDAGAQEARWLGYETMSDVDTGTGPFPTNLQVSGGLFARKSSAADSAARPWICFADNRRFYLFIYAGQTTFGLSGSTDGSMFFGQGSSLLPGDLYDTFAIGRGATGASTDRGGTHLGLSGSFGASIGHYLARPYTGISGAVGVAKTAFGVFSNTVGSSGSGLAYPNAITGSMDLAQLFLTESESSRYAFRAKLPGIFAPLHNLPAANFDTVSGSGNLAGKDFILLTVWSASTEGRVAIQTNGEVE